MRSLLIGATLLALASLGAACGTSDLVPTAARTFVAGYCAQPVTERLLLREVVASAIVPNRIQVTCAGDPPALNPGGLHAPSSPSSPSPAPS